MSGNDRLLESERGFTLLETMIAGGVLVVGVIGLMGMTITSINSNRHGSRMSQALMFAEEMAARVSGTEWNLIVNYPSALDGGQPDGFKVIDPANADPTATASAAFPPEGLTLDGVVVPANVPTAVYQRIVQVRGEDLSPMYPGNDAMRIKVTVRFRDPKATANWHEASIITLKSQVVR